MKNALLGIICGMTIGSNLYAEEKTVEVKYSKISGLKKETNGYIRRDNSDVIKVGDTYYVWYSKMNQHLDPTPSSIYYATSPDGYTWTEKGECVTPGEHGQWDSRVVYTPGILVANDQYYLFYTGKSLTPKEIELNQIHTYIGVAVADSPGGYRPGAFSDDGQGEVLKWGLHIGGERPQGGPDKNLYLERFDLIFSD